MWDQHLHCSFSGDSDASPESMIQAAISCGLEGMCFTDHMDLDYKEQPGYFLLDIPSYQKEIARLKDYYSSKLPVHWGIELGLQPYLADQNEQIASSYPFDFIIGSTHCVESVDIYYPVFYEGRTEDEAYTQYFEATLESIRLHNNFDVYGHLDYIVRYAPGGDASFHYKKHAELIDEILKLLIQKGKGIEMNMAGFKYGLGRPNPGLRILSRYHQLGGEIITVGSDAHAPGQVGLEFGKAKELLNEAGFQHYCVFDQRKPNFYSL